MQVLPLLVAFLLGVSALAFVLHPFYRHAFGKNPPIGVLAASAHPQTEPEQTARAALQEVELDYQLGNLAELDYRSLRERYVRRAFLAMKSRQHREQELDEAIEEQLRKMREQDEDAQR